ncbi:YkoF-like protein [Aspergillus recurvatus]
MASIPTPSHCTADFCLIPIGTSSPSVSAQIADVQRLIEKSGLKYVMHSAGTTLEGSWDEVHRVIGQAHTILHQQGIVRIQTDIRVGSRTDKVQSFEDKVTKVQELLKQ